MNIYKSITFFLTLEGFLKDHVTMSHDATIKSYRPQPFKQYSLLVL